MSAEASPAQADPLSARIPAGVVSWFHIGEACAGHDPQDPVRGCSVVVCTRGRPASLVRMIESLSEEERPQALLVVDASVGEEAERALRGLSRLEKLAHCVLYLRVDAERAGLTKQRNFSLRVVGTDLVAFFDDDVVLLPRCLSEMESTLRVRGDAVGAGAAVEGEAIPRIWRLRRKVRIVPTLEPGRYCRSGMSIPWGFLADGSGPAEGDWLPGCGMMWRAAVARDLSFREAFSGYGQGEDLEFCLRARASGKLLLIPTARLRHLHEPAGRPDGFRLGYAAIYNRYRIHRDVFGRGRDALWFAYAWSLDTLLLARSLLTPARASATLAQIRGRLSAAADLLAEGLGLSAGRSRRDSAGSEARLLR